jgi:hypothetical protein
MSPEARKVTSVVLLVFLAAPTGLCSMVNTPRAIGSFWKQDDVSRDIGQLELIFSSIGWLICGLCIWGAIRLLRTNPRGQPGEPPT